MGGRRREGLASGTMAPYRKPEKESVMAYLEAYLRTNSDEGEHTGYVLEVEVDVSAVQNPEELVDEQVAVTGDVEIVDYPERGKVLIFRATSAAAMEEEEPEPAG